MNRTKKVARSVGRFLLDWSWLFGFIAMFWGLIKLTGDGRNDEAFLGWVCVGLYLFAALISAIGRGNERLNVVLRDSLKDSLAAERARTDRYREQWTEEMDARRVAEQRLRKITWLMHDHHMDAIRTGTDELRTELGYLADRISTISITPACPLHYGLMQPKGEGAWFCTDCPDPDDEPEVPVDESAEVEDAEPEHPGMRNLDHLLTVLHNDAAKRNGATASAG